MAANDAAWRTMYGRLGFSANAQTKLVTTEEINTLKDLRSIVSEDRSRAVVKAIRRPGGNAAGESVSEKAEHNLRTAAYVACLWERTSRDSMDVADIILTGTLFEKAERQMQLEESWNNDSQVFEAATDSQVKNKFQEVFDNLIEMLEQVRGCTGIPLAYLVRDRLVPLADANDPANGYSTIDMELIARARIIKKANEGDDNLEEAGPEKRTNTANIDLVKLHTIAKLVFGPTSMWVHAKSAAKVRNGRLELKYIWLNEFGPNAIDARVQKVKKDIAAIAYTGEKKNFKWPNYVGRHKSCHNTMAKLVPHGYSDFTAREKVTYLIGGVKCNDLDVPINTIQSNAKYRSDFEESQLFIAEHIRMVKERSSHQDRGISKVDTSGRGGGGGRGRGGQDAGRGRGGGRGGGGREARGANFNPPTAPIARGEFDREAMALTYPDKPWYPQEVYDGFTAVQRRRVHLNQQAQIRGGGYTPRDRRSDRGGRAVSVVDTSSAASQISEITATVKSIADAQRSHTKELKRMKKGLDYHSSEESLISSDDDDANRYNPALARGSLKRDGKRSRSGSKKRS